MDPCLKEKNNFSPKSSAVRHSSKVGETSARFSRLLSQRNSITSPIFLPSFSLLLPFFLILQKLHDEALSLEGRHKDVLVLAENVSKCLADTSEAARADVEEGVAALTEKYKR